ncbi:MAG: NAD(P)H-dependent oxidoreductase [Lentilactobacillus diolivorans]|nr:NAD(P)H-dependent oxidoreductase [Lentilactobacillus diolivorans]
MKTLIMVSHPNLEQSATEAFFKTSADFVDESTWYSLDHLYSKAKIDPDREQRFIQNFDRIIFQFPLYWYSSPASLKQYMDDVFTRKFIVATQSLKNKELGIVVTTGDALTDFQAGGSERYTMSEILRPFEAFANKAVMVYLKPFVVDQFNYKEVTDKQRLLVAYLQYLNAPMPLSLENREKWLLAQLKQSKPDIAPQQQKILDLVIGAIDDQQDQIDDLKMNIKLIRDQEE